MSVEMKLELGHRASMRDEPTAEGFTHDWLVFVKGAEGSNIFTFVDKVVFHLHESFPRPRRVVKEPPYQVAESGYAGFTMPIDVYFRSKEEPKKVRFEYDLFLRLEGSPVYNIRREKLTFQNPSEDFRRKLLKAREVSSGSTVGSGTPSLQTSASIQHVDESPRLAAVHTKLTPVAEKKIKSHSTGKEASHSSHSKPNKILPPPSGALGNVSSKEPKPISKASHSPEGKEPRSKPAKPDKEPKSASKRPPPDGQNHHGSTEKKRRHHSSSDGNEKHAESNKAKETKEKKEKHKNQLSGHGSKREKHKSSSQSHVTKKDHHIIKSPSKSNSLKSVSPNRLSNEDSNDAKSSLVHGESNASSSASDLMDPTETWCEISPEKMDISSGKGSISPMSPEIEHSPPPVMEKLRRNSNHDTEESVEDKPPKPTPKAEKSPKPKNSSKSKKSAPQVNNHNNNNSTNHRSAKQNGSLKEVSHASPTAPKTKTGREALDPAYLRELVDLQKKIMSLEDRNLLQRVVDLIEETGRYQVTSKSFDFDLCSLDQSTVRKLKQCLLL